MLRDNKITFKSNDRFGGFEAVIKQPDGGSRHSQRGDQDTARGGIRNYKQKNERSTTLYGKS
jgi:hypothetical protein